MVKLRIHLAKEVYSHYDITIDTDDPELAKQTEEEKLNSSYEYEQSLKLEWDFTAGPPEVMVSILSDEPSADGEGELDDPPSPE
jgi:hypothetical protein